MGRKIIYFAGALVTGLLWFQIGAWAGESDPGRDLYLQYCSSCHGKDGKGSGSVSPFLKVKVPDLTTLKKNNKGVFPMSRVMSSIDGSRLVRGHGDPSMPVWGELFREELKKERYQELTSLHKTRAIAEHLAALQR